MCIIFERLLPSARILIGSFFYTLQYIRERLPLCHSDLSSAQMEFSFLNYSILDPNSNYFRMFILQVSAFNVNYSDSGLFGIYTISQAPNAGEVSCCL